MSSDNRASQSPVRYAYLRSDGTAYVVWGSAIAGLSAYAYQLIGGRVLGAERFAPVSVLLTIHFLTFIVIMMPIEQYTVRRLTLDPKATRLPNSAIVLGSATILAATAFAAFGTELFLNNDWRFIGFTTLAVSVHFMFVSARGHLAGWGRFKEYGLTSGAASLFRLVVALAVTLVRPSATGFALALIAGPLVALLWKPFRAPEKRPEPPEGASNEKDTNLLVGLVLATAASQALLLVGPIIVRTLGGSPVEVSIAFAAFTLGRAPLVFGYNLLARILPPFTKLAVEGEDRELTSWARGVALAGIAISAIAGLLGWVLGPWVVRIAFGPEFAVGPGATALIAAGVVLAGAGLFVGQILVAGGHTVRLALAWFVGLVAAAGALLLVPGESPLTRVSTSFIIGEAVALTALVRGAVSAIAGEKGVQGAAYEVAKRTMDIAVSLVLLIFMTPVLFMVGLIVRADSPGPIFFRQDRVGRNGRILSLVKIRTLYADNDERVFAEHLARLEAAHRAGEEVALRIDGDDRSTPVGRVLRRWSIDELPNLWNVLRGSVSLVGPRPLVPDEAKIIGLNHPRFTVKPGITGLAQVNGRDAISLAERNRLDEEYVADRSLRMDLEILASTVIKTRNRVTADSS